MPKTILTSLGKPDISKHQSLQLRVDESILDDVRSRIPQAGLVLGQILTPQDDFPILNTDLQILHEEISRILGNHISRDQVLSTSAVAFLYALDGLCRACICMGESLFGYAD